MSSIANPLKKALNIALIQLDALPVKADTLKRAGEWIERALKESPKPLDLVVLPECFNSIYANSEFPKYAEPLPEGETYKFLSSTAQKHGIYLVGGSVVEQEKSTNKLYNTALIFNPKGELICKHRKAHLFDIDIPGGVTFKESDSFSPGNKASVFNIEGFGNAGLGICYDIRFPELAQAVTRKPHNAFAMFYPSAFNTTTGPLHWHLLARARAVDNEVFVILCSQSRNLNSSYHAYGHSLVVDPYGKVIAEAGEGNEIVYATLDDTLIPKVRNAIPVHFQRRFDIYDDVSKTIKLEEQN